jgi:hypothetical protein
MTGRQPLCGTCSYFILARNRYGEPSDREGTCHYWPPKVEKPPMQRRPLSLYPPVGIHSIGCGRHPDWITGPREVEIIKQEEP